MTAVPFLVIAAAVCVSAPAITRGTGSAGESADAPNIIFIMADDLGAECFGSYGGTSYRTPNIDAIAAAGMRFENAYSMPLCGPSRACVLSGRYPFRSGVAASQGIRGFEVPWGRGPKPEITFGNLLRDAGYATAMAGKWAMCQFDKSPDHAIECGFDEYCLWPKFYAEKFTKRYWTPTVFEDGRLHADVKDTFGPDRYCDYLIRFMRRNKDRRFLLYYPMALIHGPLESPPGFEGDGEEDRSKNGSAREASPLFKANVEYMDRLVGRIVDAVDELDLGRRTLILFTADNGTEPQVLSTLGDRVVKGGKFTISDEGTRVPFVARWVGTIEPGRVSDDMIDLTDILPTFAELAGAPVPTDRIIDGRSFAPQLRGEPGHPRQWVYLEGPLKRPVDGEVTLIRSVRDREWRLDQAGNLFDMSDRYDPQLVEPGARGPEAASARKRLQAAMDSVRGTG